MIKLRKLTETEDQKFKILCDKDDLSSNDLGIGKFTGEEIHIDVEIDEGKKFNNKFELGEYLYEKLSNIPMDANTWHYLVSVYHKQLLQNNGKIGETARFYINTSRPRHLLKSVFDLYSFYHKDAELIEFLLLNPINKSGKLFMDIVVSQHIMKNINFIQVAKTLFYDKKNKKIKTGIKQDFLRLVALFKQYERNYDLYSMPADRILKNLISKHSEFNKLNPNH